MMFTASPRQLAGALFVVILALAGCSQASPPTSGQPTSVPAATVQPTLAPTVASSPTSNAQPSAQAPTAAPTAQAKPTSAPTSGTSKLPALGDPIWKEIARADLDGDGSQERILSFFSQQVEPRMGFGDPYLAGKALMADVLVIAESDDTIALQLDRTGVRASGAELWSFSPEAPVAAFAVAVDAESPLRLIGLPLAANGLQQGDAFLITWNTTAGAYKAEAIAYDGLTTTPPSDVAARPLDQQGQTEVAAWALEHLHAAAPGRPAVVGALAQAGDYAVARAHVFGEQAPRTLYLRHDAGGWAVVLDTAVAGVAQFEEAGVPFSLAQPSERRDALDAAAAHLQDARGQGMDGSLVIEAFADSFARVVFVPTDRDHYDTPTMFFAGTQSGWQFVTAGTAFTAADYDALRIPKSVR
jgi:hypothetical protein